MHQALARVAEATRATQFEGRVWLVGGAVRDELLGLSVDTNDFDLVVEGDALELARLLAERGVSSIEPVVYPRFGTALVRVEGSNVELATARRESYDPTNRKPTVRPATLAEDARRRDFTVNALMRGLHDGHLIDPLRVGLADLEARVLRTPLDPVQTFHDDPLRMLRAVRFRWKLGLEPAPGLYEAIEAEAGRLHQPDDERERPVVSAERIRDEWVKMLAHPTAANALGDLMALGLIDQFAPELRAMQGVDQGSFHHLDVWEHTLLVIDNLHRSKPEPSASLVLAALLHDVGKPRTRFIDEHGAVRFFGHESLGAEMAASLLRRLRFANETVEEVALLVHNHMRLGSFDRPTLGAARRLVRDLGDRLDDLFRLVEADADALRPGVRRLDLTPIRTLVDQVATATPAARLECPLSGEEIMNATGWGPGEGIGKVKRMLLEEVLEGRLDPGDKAGALAWLREHMLTSEDF